MNDAGSAQAGAELPFDGSDDIRDRCIDFVLPQRAVGGAEAQVEGHRTFIVGQPLAFVDVEDMGRFEQGTAGFADRGQHVGRRCRPFEHECQIALAGRKAWQRFEARRLASCQLVEQDVQVEFCPGDRRLQLQSLGGFGIELA